MKRNTATVGKGSAPRRAVPLCLAAALVCVGMQPIGASADSKDGIFPSAEQVGGQVYPESLKPGQPFPTDLQVFDMEGKPVNLANLIQGKRTVLAFFITAVPVSVAELKKLQDFAGRNAPRVQVLNLNADTVGTALEGGPDKAVQATAKTLAVIKKENGITNPLLVAPNDALSPRGLSNRLGFRGLPTIFVLNESGTVEKVLVGPQKWKKGDI